MIALSLAALSAVLYGIGDFWGGLSARRAHILHVLPAILISGILTVAAMMPLLGATYSRGAIIAGLVAGTFGSAGFFLVYMALALGPMGVASAIVAVLAAAIPYFVSVLRGQTLSAMGVAGALIALVSILLVTRTSEDAKHRPSRKMIVTAVIGGVAVAGFFLGLALGPKDSGLAPLSITRMVQLVVIGLVAVARRRTFTDDKPDYRMAVGAGIFDVFAAVAFIYAAHAGNLGAVAVVANLYPAVTVLFAHFVIHEHLERHQIVGMLGACGSVAMLTLA